MSDYKDYAARRLRPEERRGIMHMDMLSRSFRLAACDLGKRLAGYKYLNRDLGMMQSVCRRLIARAMENVDPEMRAQVLRQSRDYALGLERIAVARREEEVVMPMQDEWQFISVVLDARCAVCLKGGAESRQCRGRSCASMSMSPIPARWAAAMRAVSCRTTRPRSTGREKYSPAAAATAHEALRKRTNDSIAQKGDGMQWRLPT